MKKAQLILSKLWISKDKFQSDLKFWIKNKAIWQDTEEQLVPNNCTDSNNKKESKLNMIFSY